MFNLDKNNVFIERIMKLGQDVKSSIITKLLQNIPTKEERKQQLNDICLFDLMISAWNLPCLTPLLQFLVINNSFTLPNCLKYSLG
jgi:hypothetical protein